MSKKTRQTITSKWVKVVNAIVPMSKAQCVAYICYIIWEIAMIGRWHKNLLFSCQRNMLLCNGEQNQIPFLPSLSWQETECEVEGRACIFLRSEFSLHSLSLTAFSHIFSTWISHSLTHTSPLPVLPLPLSQWWLPMTWGGRHREYSDHLWRSISLGLTSVIKRGSTPPSPRTTAGLPNTMRLSPCE